MQYKTKKRIFFVISLLICTTIIVYVRAFAARPVEKLNIVGAGIAGGVEALFAYQNGTKIIKMFDRFGSISETTVCNIVPSFTIDEICSVVPIGPKLVRSLNNRFNSPGGTRVDDVEGINGTDTTERFKEEALKYSLNEDGINQRTQALLGMGRMSMDLWKQIYNDADPELKAIFKASNINLCSEPVSEVRKLHDGYRIDLIYNVSDAKERAVNMKNDYETFGYKNCAILTPNDVVTLDPFLKDFCNAHSNNNQWNDDTIALWRPGGCIDAQVFLPKLYEYLSKKMGTFTNENGQKENCFQIHFGKKVTGLEFENNNSGNISIKGLQFEDGQATCDDSCKCQYVFCPGESVGTLRKLGLQEPAYAGFAGVSLMLNIDIPQDKLEEYSKFNHCMEVHQEGVVLAWQARFKDNKIFIGVAGTKAFYGDQRPNKNQEFARNRNLLQLNMVNDVLPEFISMALGRDTQGKTLTENDLNDLEAKGFAKRWAGVRSVIYDGFPTLGHVYKDGIVVENARCTTHLGSGGGSFSPAAVSISRSAMNKENDTLVDTVLKFGSSLRTAQS